MTFLVCPIAEVPHLGDRFRLSQPEHFIFGVQDAEEAMAEYIRVYHPEMRPSGLMPIPAW